MIDRLIELSSGSVTSFGMQVLHRGDISVRRVYESQVGATLDMKVMSLAQTPSSFKLKSALQVLETHESLEEAAAQKSL